MPAASLLFDLDNSKNLFANPLANNFNSSNHQSLDLALELNWLNLGSESSNSIDARGNGLFSSNLFRSSQSSSPSLTHTITSNNNLSNKLSTLTQSNGMIGIGHQPDNDCFKITMAKRSQNTTECVPVPSSEHVAEIVGRQGCKIKALRAKTNTYIKTPVRGEEPVFVVTGRKEDVNAAKREILSAAEHFSNQGPAPNAHLPGHITIQVRVPYRVVGLVVGPKGATIKRIQQQTSTYIITPSREKDPVFEVTGLPDDVETARKEIEAHIAIRTGGVIDSTSGSIGTPEECTSDFSNSPLLSSFDNLFLSGLGNSNFESASKSSNYFMSMNSSKMDDLDGFLSTQNQRIANSSNQKSNNLSLLSSFGSSSANPSHSTLKNSFFPINNNKDNSLGSLCDSGKNTSSGSYDTDEGIGDSPTFDILINGNFSSLWPGESGNSFLKSDANNPIISNSLSNRRSSSVESSINSQSISSSSSSCVSTSIQAASSII
ncbi:RNA-binding protein MEX3B [Sarcoptes scabiei]|uniref:RNA-binding protein MEX3B n=1 Tax=Sarcoptes scabiei TaxID=52283 RepID=A0A834VCP2_SARSC|nr:RNA-binding protein MEX3B [Sarcoptes scabiei]